MTALDPVAASPVVRLNWLDVAKGMGILLVIFGHAVGGFRDAGMVNADGVLGTSFYTVYTFHMPLFMFLSGMLIQRRLEKGRLPFLKSLGTSIILPYLIWAPIVVLVLGAVGGLTNGGEGRSLTHSLVAILWGPPGWLWFFYSLLLCHLTAVVMPYGRYGLLLLALCLIPLSLLIKLPIVLSMTSRMLIFYALGVLIGPALTTRQMQVPSWAPAALAIPFAVAVWLALSKGVGYWSVQAIPAAICGAAAVLAASAGPLFQNNRWIAYIGKRSMAIYVLHVFFVAGVRIAFDKILGYREVAVTLPISLFAGLLGPLICYEIASRLKISEWVGLGKPIAWKRSAVVAQA